MIGLVGKILFAIALLSAPIMPSLAAEFRAEGTDPGISVVIQDLKRDESNSVTLSRLRCAHERQSFHG